MNINILYIYIHTYKDIYHFNIFKTHSARDVQTGKPFPKYFQTKFGL